MGYLPPPPPPAPGKLPASESIPNWPFDRPRWLARFFRGKEFEEKTALIEFRKAMQAASEIFSEELWYPKFYPDGS